MTLDPARLRRVGDWMQRQLDLQRTAGLGVTILHRGAVAFAESRGLADIARGRPMADDSIVRLLSMTKTITGIALMTLYEEGRLQLDDPIQRWLPSFADMQVLTGGGRGKWETEPAARAITVRDLLTHTAGLTYGFNGTSAVDAMYREHGIDHWNDTEDLATVVDRLGGIPLLFHPGARFNYSFATDVVGRLLEVITGQPLDRVLAERVTAPLGMADTLFQAPDDKLDRFAALYGPAPGGGLALLDDPQTSKYRRPRSLLSGGGGMVSTAVDYLRLIRFLANKGCLDGVRLLGRKTVELMTRNHLPGDIASMGPARFTESTVSGVGYGLGFLVMLDPAKAQIVGTPGEYAWGGNGSTAYWIDPAEDIAVLLMTQLMPSSSYTFRRELRVATYQALV